MVDNVSQAVLGGLAERHWSDAELSRDTRVPVERLDAVRRGTAELVDDETVRIEDATDLAGGQLACLVTEPGGGPLTEMADAGAAFRPSVRTAGVAAPVHPPATSPG